MAHTKGFDISWNRTFKNMVLGKKEVAGFFMPSQKFYSYF